MELRCVKTVSNAADGERFALMGYPELSNFKQAYQDSGLAAAFVGSKFETWGEFTEQSAHMIKRVAKLEGIGVTLMALSWQCEAMFWFYPNSNPNHQMSMEHCDIGPGQNNVLWCRKDIKAMEGFTEAEVFGTEYVTPDGKPLPFNGNPMVNLRVSARRLLHIRGDDRVRAIRYTGPSAQQRRAEFWDQFAPLYDKFFGLYFRP